LSVIVCNDVVWWVPFAWYLRDAWPYLRTDLASTGWNAREPLQFATRTRAARKPSWGSQQEGGPHIH
jgi:hypothetical protein